MARGNRLARRVFRLKPAVLGVAFLFALGPLLASPVTATSPTFVIEAKNIRWNPATVTVDKGDTVTFGIFNNDTVIHTFELTGYSQRADLPVDANAATTVVADRAGTFQYWCAVPGHASYDPATGRYSGMAGDFVVREPASQPPVSGAIGVVVAVAAALAVIGVLGFVWSRRRKGRGRP